MHSDQAEAALLTWLVELEQSIPFETWVSSTGALEPQVRSLYRAYTETGSRLRGHAPPRRVGRYTLLRRLGQGGLGSVHLAREDDGGCLVVLKALDPSLRERGDALVRLARELRAVSALRREAVLIPLAIDLQSETPHCVAPFVPGAPLDLVLHELRGVRPRRRAGADVHRAIETVSRRLLGPHAPSPSSAGPGFEGSYTACMLRLFLPLADALRVVHESGLVHGNIKPSNVLLGARGGSYLLDFGLARDAALPRTDTYSLGVSLYEALTGRRPFEAEGAEPDDPRDHNDALPTDLSIVLLKALEKDPELRYSAAELRSELAAVLEHRPIATRRLGRLARWARLVRRR